MQNRPQQSLVEILAFKGINADAVNSFNQLLGVGVNAAADAGLPLHTYFREYAGQILEQNGLLDVWLSAICLTTFAQGIAIGRGAQEITSDDIRAAHDNLCDEYPKCQVMRLQDYSAALDFLLEQGRRR